MMHAAWCWLQPVGSRGFVPVHAMLATHTHTRLTHAHRFIREVLDRSGGDDIQIISKIENEAGVSVRA
jgi:hypothetical protein